MRIVTLNAGSSSLKFALFDGAGLRPLLRGQVDAHDNERVLRWQVSGGLPANRSLSGIDRNDNLPGAALAAIEALLREQVDLSTITTVGHRIVHGGTQFDAPALIDAAVIDALEQLVPLAPLHQPGNLALLRAAQQMFPAARQIGCFDTAFHRTHPQTSDIYALPQRWRDAGIRRYGFHGLSYQYVISELAALAPELAAGRVVIAHLGNGASLCALKGGRSIDCTMGFSVLDGLPMGTRCGQIDPGAVLHLMQAHDLSVAQVEQLLYRDSGLRGLSGLSNDMRVLEKAAAQGTAAARLAIDYFSVRLQREIGAAAGVLGGIDALVFTGGIGEHASALRASVVQSMQWLGAELDAAANERHAPRITATGSTMPVFVIATDEETQIARACARLLA